MRKLSKRELILLVFFLGFTSLFILIEYWFFPTLAQIKELKQEREMLEVAWDELSYYIGREEELRDRIEHEASEHAALKAQLPQKDESYLYWNEMVNIANENHVSLTQLQEDDGEIESGLTTAQIQLEGHTENVETFIHQITNMPYLLAISNGNFQKNGNTIRASLSLTYSAYSNDLHE